VSDLMAVAQRAFGAGSAGNEGAPASERRQPAASDPSFAGSDTPPPRVIVCNDARMREVYWACFEQADGLAALVGDERVSPPESVAPATGWTGPVLAAGRGFAAYPHLRSRLGPQLATIHERMLPRAHEIALLAAPMLQKGGAVPPDQAVPVYLRDEVAQPAER
jgi:tRNA threonylcarbamoyladenosine biosynthesis protein TsaB